MLTKSLKEQDPNTGMYDYIVQALRFLDQTTGNVSDFHLVFLLRLSRYLGFQPRNNYDTRHCYFNLKEGMFQTTFGSRDTCLDHELSQLFHQINTTDLEHIGELSIAGVARRHLLQKTIEYYRYHLEGFQEVRSHFVLEMVLN